MPRCIVGVLAGLAVLYLGIALRPAIFARDLERRTDAAKVIDEVIDLILALLLPARRIASQT